MHGSPSDSSSTFFVDIYWATQALGGALHNTIIGDLVVEFDPSLLTNTVLQEAVFAHNEAQNGVGGGTYLLPQVTTHPTTQQATPFV